MIILRPCVWHHAPFVENNQQANVIIILSERAYANDCEVVELKEVEQIKIIKGETNEK